MSESEITSKGFYGLSKPDRIALTSDAVAKRQTLFARWNNLPKDEAESWDERSAIAATYLLDVNSVADLGCGHMRLERYLAKATAYFPVDVTRRDERTLVCDFNSEPLVRTPADAAVCLGLLEYLFEPAAFLEQLAHQYRKLVVSYCVADLTPDIASRREHAWVNELSHSQIEAIFAHTGWTIEQSKQIDNLQYIWLLRSPLEPTNVAS